jgi:hypothetical protein
MQQEHAENISNTMKVNPVMGVCALLRPARQQFKALLHQVWQFIINTWRGRSKNRRISKHFRTDDKLTEENYLLREISEQITERIREQRNSVFGRRNGNFWKP